MVTVRPGGAFDEHGQLIARNAVDLVREILHREGKPSGREEAVGWLADHCGKDRAKAASMVEHEQAMDDHLYERQTKRDRAAVKLTKDQTLARPEPIRDHSRGRDGYDRDLGFSR